MLRVIECLDSTLSGIKAKSPEKAEIMKELVEKYIDVDTLLEC